jgi:hypothetical protein
MGRATSAGLGIPRGYRSWAQTVRLPVVARSLVLAIKKPKTSRLTQSPARAADRLAMAEVMPLSVLMNL